MITLKSLCGRRQDLSMKKFDKLPTRKKVFRANHLGPGDFALDYILLPIGYSYNSDWLRAKRGDFIRMHDGMDHKLFCVRIIKVRGGLADLLCRMRYGITFRGCMQRWKRNVQLEGHATTAISEDECLWIVYEKGEVIEEEDGGRDI